VRALNYTEDQERKIFIGEPVFAETSWLAAGKNMAAEIAEVLAEGTRLIFAGGMQGKTARQILCRRIIAETRRLSGLPHPERSQLGARRVGQRRLMGGP